MQCGLKKILPLVSFTIIAGFCVMLGGCLALNAGLLLVDAQKEAGATVNSVKQQTTETNVNSFSPRVSALTLASQSLFDSLF